MDDTHFEDVCIVIGSFFLGVEVVLIYMRVI